MKKILFLITMVILLSGCSSEYSVYFNENSIDESINIIIDGNINDYHYLEEEDGFYIETEILKNQTPVLNNDSRYYQQSVNIKDNKSYVLLTSKYQYDDLKDSYLINNCYDNVFVKNTEDNYYVSLSGFDCQLKSVVKLKVSSYYKILKANTDIIEDNSYVWNIDGDKEDNPIELTILKVKNDSSLSSNHRGFSIAQIVMVVIFFITGVILVVVHKKRS